jgi:hypothetical protein
VSKIDINSFFWARKGLISPNALCEPKFKFHLFECAFRKIFTARSPSTSLRVSRAAESAEYFFIVFSPERGENTMNQARPKDGGQALWGKQQIYFL